MGLNYIPWRCESDLRSQALLGNRAQNKFLTECNLMCARWGWDEGGKWGINGEWAREMSSVCPWDRSPHHPIGTCHLLAHPLETHIHTHTFVDTLFQTITVLPQDARRYRPAATSHKSSVLFNALAEGDRGRVLIFFLHHFIRFSLKLHGGGQNGQMGRPHCPDVWVLIILARALHGSTMNVYSATNL